jgi:hypothetical protein
MSSEKKQLSFEEIEAQTAMELPDRETPIAIIVTCLAICIGQVRLDVRDVNLAVALCAEIEAITVNGVDVFNCEIETRQR